MACIACLELASNRDGYLIASSSERKLPFSPDIVISQLSTSRVLDVQ